MLWMGVIWLINNFNYILILNEQEAHPNSFLLKLMECFEKPSILKINKASDIQSIKTKPLLDEKYLAIFNSFFVFRQVYSTLNFEIFFPVYLCSRKSDIFLTTHLLEQSKIPFKIYKNPFSSQDAIDLIIKLSNENLTEKLINSIKSRTGYSAKRIIEAIDILNQVGFSKKNIERYICYNNFVNTHSILKVLLKAHTAKKEYRNVLNYVYLYANSYNSYIKRELLKELILYLNIYMDIIQGVCNLNSPLTYIDSVHALTPFKFLDILELFEVVSIYKLQYLYKQLENSNLLSFVSLL